MTGRRTPSPPWIPEALLWLVTRRADWRATVIGDLREEFAARATQSRRRATVWYWAEALRLLTSGVRGLGVRYRGTDAAPTGTVRPTRTAFVRDIVTDSRLALRMMRRQPGVTGVVVLTLALGIGSTAVIFNLLDTLVLRVLDLPGDGRLVMLSERRPSSAPEDRATAPANYLDWRAGASSFGFMGAYDTTRVNLADAVGVEHPERVVMTATSAGLLEALGVRLHAGRMLEPADEVWGAPPVAVLSDAFWRARFGASPAVIGRTVLLDERPHIIVGITLPGMAFPRETGVWTSLALAPDAVRDRTTRHLNVVGKLRDGIALSAARAELEAISMQLQRTQPETNRSVTAAVTPLAAAVRDEAAPAMIAVWQAAAAFVLLIACVNVAQLLLARGRSRRREFMVRVSLGAGLGRLARQLLVEGCTLAAVAAALALGIGWLALRTIKAALPPELARFVAGWEMIGVDARLVMFTCVVAVFAAVLFSLMPMMQAARVDLADGLKQGGRGQTGDGTGWRRGSLTAIEIAGALVLTVATVLAVRGASDLLDGDPGFDDTGVVAAAVSLPEASYATADAQRQFFDRALAELAIAPGLAAPAIVNAVPSALTNASRPVIVEGGARDSSDLPRADYRVISPAYFDALRIPVVAGRALLDADRHDTQAVAVVSRSMAERFWPDVDPIGQRFRQRADGPWIVVVGVAGDVVHHWFNRRRHPTVYRPYAQDPQPVATIVARADGDPLASVPALRSAIGGVDPRLPLYDVATLTRMREVGVTGLTFLVQIMTVLCGLAVLLASVGIYAVVAHGVTSRRREIGLRVALGAAPWRIVRDEAQRVAFVTGAGVIAGVAGALVVGKVMAATMFGLISLDAGVYLVAVGGLTTIATAAGLLPARAALSVDPATALRAE